MKHTFLELLEGKNKPIIGMLHLAGLPGSVHHAEPFSKVLEQVIDEAKTLVDAGFDALLLQNAGDVPASEEGDEATTAFMTAAGMKIKEVCPAPIGVNVLMNGSRAALSVAKAIGGEFVRIKIAIGAVVTSTGLIQADPHEVLAFRRRIGADDVAIIADLYDRTSAPLGEFPLPVMADLALRHAGASALVISGYDVADTQSRLKTLRKALPGALLITGGGANAQNLPDFLSLCDAVIVGSSIKKGGGFLDPVDPARAREFMRIARSCRSL